MSEALLPIDDWLSALGVEVVGTSGPPSPEAFSRDVVLDGERRFDLRVTVAWVGGIGLSLWAYYGLEHMEIPRRVLHEMLRANFDYPFVKFGLTDDERPMLVTELPASALTRDELARALVRLTVVADRLLELTAAAVADRAVLPDWSERRPRNAELLAAYRTEIEGEMPVWQPPPPKRARRSPLGWLRGAAR